MEYIVTVNQEKTKQNCSLSQMQILGREEENKDFVTLTEVYFFNLNLFILIGG